MGVAAIFRSSPWFVFVLFPSVSSKNKTDSQEMLQIHAVNLILFLEACKELETSF